MHSPAELAIQFRSMGRKLTPQRQLIFSLLHNNETHPTAENLYGIASAQMPGISLRTVYQTLNELAEMGELQLIDLGEGGMRFGSVGGGGVRPVGAGGRGDCGGAQNWGGLCADRSGVA